ncbi:MAG: DUF2460 domain-containing protein [Pseudomonadota bacterium]
MSTAILPSLVGLGFDVVRTPKWDTRIQQSISGKETRIAMQSYPRWQWDLTYNILRSGSAFAELQQLVGFFNQRQGMFDTFLYQDADDKSVTAQGLGLGDGVTRTFSLVRNFGGFVEPILAPNVVSNVYLNGVLQSPANYSVAGWGSANPGVITFVTAPSGSVSISADFSYYFPVRMTVDSVAFSLFISGHYKAKKFSFISVKN